MLIIVKGAYKSSESPFGNHTISILTKSLLAIGLQMESYNNSILVGVKYWVTNICNKNILFNSMC